MNKGKKAQKVATKQETFNPKNYEKNGLTEDEVLEIKYIYIKEKCPLKNFYKMKKK